MKFSRRAALALLAGWITACGANQNVDVPAIQTNAVATYSASLTGTLPAVQQLSPTPTSLPTFTPSAGTPSPQATATKNPCYDLIWLKDKTIPDGTYMRPGESFTKTWIVQNNGGCAWAAGFTFQHFGGEIMLGKPVVLTEPIPVGAKRELSIEFVVPAGASGLTQSAWRMADASGAFFGDTLTVNIIVGSPPTATASP